MFLLVHGMQPRVKNNVFKYCPTQAATKAASCRNAVICRLKSHGAHSSKPMQDFRTIRVAMVPLQGPHKNVESSTHAAAENRYGLLSYLLSYPKHSCSNACERVELSKLLETLRLSKLNFWLSKQIFHELHSRNFTWQRRTNYISEQKIQQRIPPHSWQRSQRAWLLSDWPIVSKKNW